MPTVSVIVPNYNHARYLNQRIDSILEQTFQDFELILLDDCSTDNSREIIESYRNNPHVSHIVYNETNGGSPFAQWNKGIELACGEWIWIAESDDWAEKEFLKELLYTASQLNNVSLAYTSTNFVNENGDLIFSESSDNTILYYDGKDYISNKLIYNNPIHNVSMVIFKKAAFEEIDQSLYDKMVLCGDWFFYVQILLTGGVVVINKLYNNYRIHATNTSNWTEKEGLTFIEGIEILDFIKGKFHIRPSSYNKRWGKMMSDYRFKYGFSHDVNNKIQRIFKKSHKIILFYYWLYSIKRLICLKK